MFLSLHPQPAEAEVFLLHNCLFFSVHENDCIHITGTHRETEEHERESVPVYEFASTCNVVYNVTKILTNAGVLKDCVWRSLFLLEYPDQLHDPQLSPTVVEIALGTVALTAATAADAWKPKSFWIHCATRQFCLPTSAFKSCSRAGFEDWDFKYHLPAQHQEGLQGWLHLHTLQGVDKTGVMRA